MKSFNTIIHGISTLAIIALVIILLRECNGKKEAAPGFENTGTIESVTNYVHDTFPKYIKVPVVVPEIIFQPVSALVDTQAFLKDCFAKKIYRRFITDDTAVKISFVDTVSQNEITGTSLLKVQFLKPTAIITQNTTPPAAMRNKIFVGISGVGNIESQSLQLNAALCTKRDHLYFIGYNYFTQSAELGFFLKIKFKK